MSLVVAVAPGARHTAVVLRSDDILRGHQLVDRVNSPLDWYLKDVVDAVTRLKDRARTIVLQDTPNVAGAPAVLALLDPINAPGDRDDTRVEHQVVGAISGHWICTRIGIQPDPQPLTFYPDRLQDRGTRGRQLRAAWDVAGHVLDADREEATT